jgi:hypothetical protein
MPPAFVCEAAHLHNLPFIEPASERPNAGKGRRETENISTA